MKQIKLLPVIFILFSLLAFKKDNTSVDWYSWNDGYTKGMKENKIILIDCYTDWCGWCKKMDQNTYTNEQVVKMVEEHFMPIKFNPEEKKTYQVDGKEVNGRELQKMLSHGNQTGYPTTFFIIPELNKVYIEAGYQGPKKFKKTLKKYMKIKAKAEVKQKKKQQAN